VPEPALATVETAGPRTRSSTRTWATFEAAAAPLDAHLGRFRDVSFVKADLEGHEAAFLAGATRTIAAFRPAIQIEAHGIAANAPAVQAWLDAHDYRMLTLGRGGLAEPRAGEPLPLNVYLLPREAIDLREA
jgi:hypothetical protein